MQKTFLKHIFIELEAGLGVGFEPRGFYKDQNQVTDSILDILLEDITSHQVAFLMKPSFLNLNIGFAF